MAAETKPKSKKVPALRVKSKTAGFRRAGRAWSTEVTDVAVSDFSKDQLAQLKADPELVVVETEIEVAAE